jgi:Holliday junction DNA helicase RuvA
MVDSIRGTVVRVHEDGITIACGCFTVKVFVPQSLLKSIKAGQTVELFTKLTFPPEGTPSIYGFATTKERALFEVLTKIPRLSSKVAMNLLSRLGTDGLKEAVASEDVETLSCVPGIGRKLSRRIIAELKSAFKEEPPPAELVKALTSLGYSRKEIARALEGESFSGLSLEDAIKAVVQKLSRRGT